MRSKLPEGPYTRKRLTKASAEKFTPVNTVYCQQFLNTLGALPPEKLKFFDEAGVHSGTGNPAYGNSLKGEIAVEVISGNKKGANVTLSLLPWTGRSTVCKHCGGRVGFYKFSQFLR